METNISCMTLKKVLVFIPIYNFPMDKVFLSNAHPSHPTHSPTPTPKKLVVWASFSLVYMFTDLELQSPNTT